MAGASRRGLQRDASNQGEWHCCNRSIDDNVLLPAQEQHQDELARAVEHAKQAETEFKRSIEACKAEGELECVSSRE